MFFTLKPFRSMSVPYAFDSVLNLNQCLKNTPPLGITFDNLPELTKTELTDLENKCRKVNIRLENNIFFKHIGPGSRYEFKAILKNQLALIYHRILGTFDQQLGPLEKKIIEILLIELVEDIQECTPGFHIRVNKLVNLLEMPKNLDQLLYLARKNIIQDMASYLANVVEPSYQVHLVNRVFRIAKKEGLAIEPSIQKDPYKSLLSGTTIRKYLKANFPLNYTALKIPFLLTEQLRSILSQHRYIGPQETGYAIGPAEEMLDTIHIFLSYTVSETNNKFLPFFILDKFDEFDEPTRIYDINWSLIQQLFFQKLNDDGYFTAEPTLKNLMDYAYYQALVPEKANQETENQLINRYINEKNYAEIIEALILIQDKFPDYWDKIIRNSIILSQINSFFNYLNEQSSQVTQDEIFFRKIKLIYTLFFSQKKSIILRKICDYTKTNTTINYYFLLKSIQYRPEIIQDFFNLLFFNITKPYKFFLDLLFIQNSEGATLFMLVGRYHTESLQFILNLLNHAISNFNKEEISKLFFIKQYSGHHFMSLVAKYQPASITFIFDFFRKNALYFDEEVIGVIFNQKISNWNFLSILASYQTENEINVCLDFISQKFKYSKNKKWLELVINPNMGDVLRLAARSYSNTLCSFLNFIEQHINEIEFSVLNAIFLRINKNNLNCLHTAAQYESRSLILLLQFIKKNRSKLSDLVIKNLFLAQTKNGYNFLMFAAYYQIETTSLVLNFMQQHTQIFDTKTLKKLFLQQNEKSWNILGSLYNQPDNLNTILKFIAENLDAKTLSAIIFQKNKQYYTCLHLAVRFQPNSVKNILECLSQHPDSFSELERLLLEKDKNERNLLSLSLHYQPESALYFLNFFNSYLNYFDKLKKNTIFKTFICQTLLFAHDPELIKKTLYFHNDLLVNNFYKLSCDKRILPCYSGLFRLKVNFCRQFEAAAQAFKDLLKKGIDADGLKELKITHPEVAQGELGKLYRVLNQAIARNFTEFTSAEIDLNQSYSIARIIH